MGKMVNNERLSQAEVAWRSQKLNQTELDYSGEIIWTSQEGIELLEQRIQAILARQEEVLTLFGKMADGGHDLPDNTQFKELMVEWRSVLPRQLADLKRKKTKALPFQSAAWFRSHDFHTITLGTRITVAVSESEEETYDLLGPLEASYAPPNRSVLPISYESPVGQALIGKKAGDVVTLESGWSFKVLETKQIIFPLDLDKEKEL